MATFVWKLAQQIADAIPAKDRGTVIQDGTDKDAAYIELSGPHLCIGFFTRACSTRSGHA
jgi:hypothetical protein